MRVRVTIFGVERNEYCKIWLCVCSLIYPTCKSHLYVPYYIAVSSLLCCTAFWNIFL